MKQNVVPIFTGSEMFYVDSEHAEDVEASAGNDETGQGFFDDVCLNWRAYEEQIALSLADSRSFSSQEVPPTIGGAR